MFGSQEYRQDRPQAGFEKDNILNLQEFRPGRSAIQRHYGLRLFFKNPVTWYIVLRPLLSFFLTNEPQMTLLFRVDSSKTVWSCECAIHSSFRFFSFIFRVICSSFRFFRLILVNMLLINNTMLQVEGMCWAPNIQHKSNTNSGIRYLMIGTNMLIGFWLFTQLFLSWSVRKHYLRAIYNVHILIGSWCAAFPFLPRNCPWLPLRISSRGV